MTFKIEGTQSGEVITLRLIGGLNSECLGELKQQIEHAGPRVVLDLAEVELVDVDMVRFLGVCELEGMKILHCSPYIREWILREQQRNR